MITVRTLDELTELSSGGPGLYIRWSQGPEADEDVSSSDELTSVPMPGLSATPLAVEPWWGNRPARLWIARRLYDYSHLKRDKGPGVRPWVLQGREAGRGPDNEPLVADIRPVAWVADEILAEAERVVAEQNRDWGPLRRPTAGR